MTGIGTIIGGIILFYFIGVISFLAVYLIYAAIHISGILLNILPPPFYDLDFVMGSLPHLFFTIGYLVIGAIVFFSWEHWEKKKNERRKQLRKQKDEYWKKEDLFHKYKSFYEREKKRKRKRKKRKK